MSKKELKNIEYIPYYKRPLFISGDIEINCPEESNRKKIYIDNIPYTIQLLEKQLLEKKHEYEEKIFAIKLDNIRRSALIYDDHAMILAQELADLKYEYKQALHTLKFNELHCK